MTLHLNTHPVCGGCWIEVVSAQLPVVEFEGMLYRCCRCNRPTAYLLEWWIPAEKQFVPHCPEAQK